MSDCNTLDSSLLRNGTNQSQRNIEQLNPDNLELQNLDIADWILFAYSFAKQVNFFETNDSKNPKGNWQVFFDTFQINTAIPPRGSRAYNKIKGKVIKVLSQYEKEGNLTPHLNLFVSFLKLLEFSKERFNKLTKRHLDFYYKEILQVDKHNYQPDKAHVLFELAKKSVEQIITTGTKLNAGKDKLGKSLIYKTTDELIVNQGSIASLKSIYNNPDLRIIKASHNPKTTDGIEKKLPKNNPYWYPFGYYATTDIESFTELPNASLGFALASPIFDMKEGARNIEISISFDKDIKQLSVDELIRFITINASGEDNWIENIQLKKTIQVTNSVEKKDNTTKIFQTLIDGKQLKLAFTFDKTIPKIAAFNTEISQSNYQTKHPIIKFLIDTQKDDKAYDLYQNLSQIAVENISIIVDVKGVKSPVVYNDLGEIKVDKPFNPFTSKPIKGSNLYIDYQEVFSKKWKNFDVNINWKDTPDSFKDRYAAYLSDSCIDEARNAETKEDAIDNYYKKLSCQIVDDDNYFTVQKSILHKNEWENIEISQKIFSKRIDSITQQFLGFETIISLKNNDNFVAGNTGPFKLTLDQSFLHEKFTQLYTLALIDVDKKLIIPNEPYTPLAEDITIGYRAEESTDFTKLSFDAYRSNRINLFHNHPFGQCEEHNYLTITKRDNAIIDLEDPLTIKSTLVPKYNKKSSLFIGIKNSKALQTISLLVQVFEGSENPDKAIDGDTDTIHWSILCDNKWKDLKDSIISDDTNNFLKSGIIKFSIPEETTDTNTLLPTGYVWVKVQMDKDYDAVCKLIDIHTQAVTVDFINNNNELSHLNKGLKDGSIQKLITRIPQIKSVSQPYNSFNGSFEESDIAFYTRISERLRHKNRAISQWDYEHIILQEFTEVHRVKCLNHTASNSFQSAGDITIVVIPKTASKNSFDVYKPRHSTNTLQKIATHINRLNSLHINAQIINPVYEEVQVSLFVKFRDGLDVSYYEKQIEEDITKYLSPWAFDKDKEIDFGQSLQKSRLIDYLEKLAYIDYLENITFYINEDDAGNNIKPSNPKAILVSAKQHIINSISQTCKTVKN